MEKEYNKKCVWKEVAESDEVKRDMKEGYTTLDEKCDCVLCPGFRINTCDKYLPKDWRMYDSDRYVIENERWWTQE